VLVPIVDGRLIDCPTCSMFHHFLTPLFHSTMTPSYPSVHTLTTLTSKFRVTFKETINSNIDLCHHLTSILLTAHY
jgi:hypothetical protein